MSPIGEVRELLAAAADPARAPEMAAYMKGVAPFLGVTTPARRAATGPWIRSFMTGRGVDELLATARDLTWQPQREFAYVAIDLVSRHQRMLPDTCLSTLRELALHVPWWDTVDAWAHVIGRAGLPQWDAQVCAWSTEDQLWARRIALVFQVGRGASTDLDILFAACRANLADRDFFMRKGIGWGLRDAARTYPDQVRAFVEENRERMAPLSIREATRHL